MWKWSTSESLISIWSSLWPNNKGPISSQHGLFLLANPENFGPDISRCHCYGAVKVKVSYNSNIPIDLLPFKFNPQLHYPILYIHRWIFSPHFNFQVPKGLTHASQTKYKLTHFHICQQNNTKKKKTHKNTQTHLTDRFSHKLKHDTIYF